MSDLQKIGMIFETLLNKVPKISVFSSVLQRLVLLFMFSNIQILFTDSLLRSSIQATGWWSRFGCRRSFSPWAAAWLLSPSLPAAGASRARCYVAAPPSVPPVSLPGGWCPERRMTNASASAYWRIWTTWLQPRTVPTASTRCWLNGRGLAVEGPICVCIGKIWQGGVSVYVCVFIGLVCVCLCASVCVCVCVFSPSPDCRHPSCHGALAESGTQTASLTHGQLNCLLNCPGP